MPSQTSKTSQEALKNLAESEYVVTSTRTQKPVVSAELQPLYRQALPQEGEAATPPIPDWDQVQEANAGLLEWSAREVRRTDRAHRRNKVRLSELRRRRRQQVDDLRQQHRDHRKSFEGTYGEESLALVGLDATPTDAFLAVREQALETVERMRTPELASRLREPRAGQSPFDLEQIAGTIETGIGKYEALSDEIEEMRKRVDESLVVKRETLKRHRRIYVNVARIQEGYYRLAGFDELALRIRSPEAPRRSKAEDGKEPAAAGETPEAAEAETAETLTSPTQ